MTILPTERTQTRAHGGRDGNRRQRTWTFPAAGAVDRRAGGHGRSVRNPAPLPRAGPAARRCRGSRPRTGACSVRRGRGDAGGGLVGDRGGGVGPTAAARPAVVGLRTSGAG